MLLFLLLLAPEEAAAIIKPFVPLVLMLLGSATTSSIGVLGLFSVRVTMAATDTSASVLMSSSSSYSMSHPTTTTSTIFPYDIPKWAKETHLESSRPKFGRLKLGNLPTPIHGLGSSERFQPYSSLNLLHELNITLDIKRDDMTGGPELGGNKVRKLEFLLADALGRGCDSIVTIGGEQSNHCRATACAARLVGLYPHLILRTSQTSSSSSSSKPSTPQVESSSQTSTAKDLRNNFHDDVDVTLGLQGNIIFDRIVGSTIHTCTTGEYGRFGSVALVDMVCSSLRTSKEIPNKSSNPYPIPVGGSNALGTWGYIEGVNELIQQQLVSAGRGIDSIVVATGSGGTLAGIVLGLMLYYHQYSEQQQIGILHHRPVVHAVGVCDDPNYFYKKLDQISEEMGYYSTATDASTTLRNEIEDWVKIHQGKGRGYAQSTPEELEFIQQFAQCTGIALDPVYTGKALYHFVHEVVKKKPETYRNSRVLFWHTGGSLGLQVRSTELMHSLKEVSPVHKLDVYRKKGVIQ